ncbi:MAG TPA: LptE family protein [Candidatus Acidoferrum sp.]|nr:LptE family protein [Candidatus Acidoferrum sp.]
MRAVAALAVVLVTLACAGCGYSLRGNLPAHIKTVAVPIFQNRTPVPAVENFLTNAVVNAFSANGRLRVTTVDRADAILDGEITSYVLQSIAYDAAANIRQFRLTVTLNLRFRDVRRNEVLFQRTGFADRADFAVPGTVAETITTSESALQQAATDIARSVVSFAVERF